MDGGNPINVLTQSETHYHRWCSTCGVGMNEGYLCCDEYYCGETCLAKSFEGTGLDWSTHFTEDGDCYYTDWWECADWDEDDD